MALCDDYLTACATPEDNRLWGDVVTLRRGLSTASVTAVWQRPKADTIDQEGFATDYEAREWVIAKASYAFSGVATDPRAVDRIVDADGTWQVLPDDAGPAWHADGLDWVIKTRKVAA